MLNETIICEGYAPALTRYPFRRERSRELGDTVQKHLLRDRLAAR